MQMAVVLEPGTVMWAEQDPIPMLTALIQSPCDLIVSLMYLEHCYTLTPFGHHKSFLSPQQKAKKAPLRDMSAPSSSLTHQASSQRFFSARSLEVRVHIHRDDYD